MSIDRADEEWVALQVCPDHLAAAVLANFLKAHGVPCLVRNLSALPGLEKGAEVRVPARSLHRARWLNTLGSPTDTELDAMASGQWPLSGDQPP
jgi:hypothetical protein